MRPAVRRVSAASLLAISGAFPLVACDAIIGTEDRYVVDGGDAPSFSFPDATTPDAAREGDAAGPDDDATVLDAPSGATDAADAGDAAVDAAPPDPTLVAFWTFDEDGGDVAHDGTGHGNDLALSNGATIGGTGYFGTGALQFPPLAGQAVATMLSGAGFPPVGTLSMWIYFDPTMMDEARNIFEVADSTRRHFDVRYVPGNVQSSSTYAFTFEQPTGAGNSDFGTSLSPLQTGAWNHWVIVWDTRSIPASVQFYIADKIPPAFTTTYTEMQGAPLDENFLLYNDFGGAYDDVYLWNRAFSESDVVAMPTR